MRDTCYKNKQPVETKHGSNTTQEKHLAIFIFISVKRIQMKETNKMRDRPKFQAMM